MTGREPLQCPLRREEPLPGKVVYCEWLKDRMEGLPRVMAEVSPAICSACCRSFLPTSEDWNPVVASLVWSRCSEALRDSESSRDLTPRSAESATTSAITPAGIEPRRWQLAALIELAESYLPVVTQDEEDLPASASSLASIDGDREAFSLAEVERRLPRPVGVGRRLSRWAVGVTTSPRRLPTLEASVASLAASGWAAPRLFVDGSMELPANCRHLPRTERWPAVGAWRGYYLALVELLAVNPSADALLLIQDDALWPGGAPLRAYLEDCEWPVPGPFVLSCYCCADYTAPRSGWHVFDGVWTYGAVALAFSRDAAEALIDDPLVRERCRVEASGGIDTVIGAWATRVGIPILYPTPSIVQHIGDVSTLWRESRAVGVRRAARFLGDELRRGDEPPGNASGIPS